MDRTCYVWALVLMAAIGCGKSDEPAANGGSGAALSPLAIATDSPAKAVHEFLEAVRTGNDERTAELLTPTARQKTAEFEMTVAPPGSPKAQFTVGEVEFVTPEKDGAHVWCKWTDVVDEQGGTRTDEIIWVLRKEEQGWRVAGMVTKVFPGQPPLVLNFEDPEDMIRKQQMLQQAMEQGIEAVQQQQQAVQQQPPGIGTQPQATLPQSASPPLR